MLLDQLISNFLVQLLRTKSCLALPTIDLINSNAMLLPIRASIAVVEKQWLKIIHGILLMNYGFSKYLTSLP